MRVRTRDTTVAYACARRNSAEEVCCRMSDRVVTGYGKIVKRKAMKRPARVTRSL